MTSAAQEDRSPQILKLAQTRTGTLLSVDYTLDLVPMC